MDIKLDPELKARWLEALRGGEYQQVEGILHGPSGFCCLGVLCDIKGAKWTWNDEEERYKLPSEANSIYEWEAIMPPESYRDDALKQNTYQDGASNHVDSHLAGMNDDGMTFEEIADWIEKGIVKTISNLLREIAGRSTPRDSAIILQAANLLEQQRHRLVDQACTDFQRVRDLFD